MSSTIMTPDWVHCNACFTQENISRPLSMYNCGHVACNSCLAKYSESNANKPVCVVCANPNSKVVPVTNDLQLYFSGTDNRMKESLKIYEFERFQQDNLLKHYKLRAKQSKQLAEEVERLKKECKRHSDDKNKLKNDLIEKTKIIKQLTNQLEAKKVHTVGDLFSNATPAASRLRNNKQQHLGPRSSNSPFSLLDSGVFSSSGSNNSNGANVFTPPQDLSVTPSRNKLARNFNATRTTSLGASSPFNSPLQSSCSQQSPGAVANRRRVYLPGDHRGKENSNVTKIGLHRLSLSQPNQLTSTFWKQNTNIPVPESFRMTSTATNIAK